MLIFLAKLFIFSNQNPCNKIYFFREVFPSRGFKVPQLPQIQNRKKQTTNKINGIQQINQINGINPINQSEQNKTISAQPQASVPSLPKVGIIFGEGGGVMDDICT